MRDGGEQLRQVIERERKLEHWLDVLPLYAELQIAAAADAEQLLARGAPDRGLATLPQPVRTAARPDRGPADSSVRRIARSLRTRRRSATSSPRSGSPRRSSTTTCTTTTC